jgi:hypothetical protein
VEHSQSSAIAQRASVLRVTRFASYRTGSGSTMAGKIPLLARQMIVLSEVPVLILLVVTIFCFAMAALMWAMVRQRARARLQGID